MYVCINNTCYFISSDHALETRSINTSGRRHCHKCILFKIHHTTGGDKKKKELRSMKFNFICKCLMFLLLIYMQCNNKTPHIIRINSVNISKPDQQGEFKYDEYAMKHTSNFFF